MKWVEVKTPGRSLFYTVFFKYWEGRDGRFLYPRRTLRFNPFAKPTKKGGGPVVFTILGRRFVI